MIGIKARNKHRKKYDSETIMLIILLILAENMLCLVDIGKMNMGPLTSRDIGICAYVMFGIYVLIKYRNEKITPKYKFKFVCLFTIVLVVLSSVRTYQLFGQSIMLGMRPQRWFLISFLMYFIMVRYFYLGEEKIRKLEKAMYVVGTTELCLYITQYFLAGIKLFLYIVPKERYGEVRLMFETNLLPVFIFIVYNNLLKGKEVKKNIVLLLLNAIYLLIVSKTRLMVLGTGLALIVLTILWKKNIILKLGLMFISLGFLVIFLQTPLMSNYISVLNPTVRQADGTYTIRVKSKEFYKNELKKSPITGRGYVNELNDKAVDASLQRKGYFVVDNGIIGFAYFYGLLGVGWMLLLMIEIAIRSIQAYKKHNDYSILGYIVFCAVIMSNILELYWLWGSFYTSLILSVLEYTSEKRD